MNESLKNYAQQQLIEGLKQCTAGQVMLFKRMYAFKHLDWDIEKVVKAMPEEKLDWAMQQVERTLEKDTLTKDNSVTVGGKDVGP